MPEPKNEEILISSGVQEALVGSLEPSLTLASNKFHLLLFRSQILLMATINGLCCSMHFAI